MIYSIGTGKDPEDKESVVLDSYGGTVIPAEMRLNSTRYLWLRFLSDFVNERSGWSVILATVPNSSKYESIRSDVYFLLPMKVAECKIEDNTRQIFQNVGKL